MALVGALGAALVVVVAFAAFALVPLTALFSFVLATVLALFAVVVRFLLTPLVAADPVTPGDADADGETETAVDSTVDSDVCWSF